MSQAHCANAEYIGGDARLLIVPLGSTPKIVGGLNGYNIGGVTRDKVTIDDFTRDFAGGRAGSGSMNDFTFKGNYLAGNEAQDILQKRIEENTVFTDLRLYLNWQGENPSPGEEIDINNRGDFWALDLAKNPCSKMQMSSWASSDVGKADVLPFSGGCYVDGSVAIFNVHSADALEYDVAAGVLTATDGDFVTRGFKANMSVIMETGLPSKRYVYATVSSVTATTITFKDTSLVLSSSEGQIHGSTKTAAKA